MRPSSTPTSATRSSAWWSRRPAAFRTTRTSRGTSSSAWAWQTQARRPTPTHGRGGGFPGHATRTLLDPRDRLVVVVLVNEIGGPADALARAIVTLIDFALRQPRASAGRAPDTHVRFTGQFVNLWGVTDVAAFGDTV